MAKEVEKAIDEQFKIGDIPFIWPSCQILEDRAVFDKTYGDKELSGGNNTHWKLHRERADNIYKSLMIEIKRRKAAIKRAEDKAKAAKPRY